MKRRRQELTILFALLLAVALQPATAQVAPPSADMPEPREVELPRNWIVALSPDGTRLVAGNEPGTRQRQLCIFEVATLSEQTCGDLWKHEMTISLDSVVWSPDSTRIAFAEEAFRYGNDGDLWLMDAASGKLTNLTDDGYVGPIPTSPDEELAETLINVDILPAWAPDGRSIAFSRSPIFGGEVRGAQVVSIDLASGKVETLAPVTPDAPGVVNAGLAWAPDGQRLYYSVIYTDPRDPRNGVWVYDSATARTELLLGNDRSKGARALIRVAATGQTALIFYPYGYLQIPAENGRLDRYVLLDLESNRLTPVHPVAPDPVADPAIVGATFSPDGTRVLYAWQPDDSESMTSLLMRELPDGQPEVVSADLGLVERFNPLEAHGGLFWATDGTALMVFNFNSGFFFDLETDPVARRS